MSTYCNKDNIKATITVNRGDKVITIISSNPPIDVQCKDNPQVPPCTKVRVTMAYTDSHHNTDTTTRDFYAPVTGIRINPGNQTVDIKCSGWASSGSTCGSLGWYNIGDLTGTATYTYVTATISDVQVLDTITYPKSTGIIIKDAFGKIIFNDEAASCSVSVRCDDDCPEGQCKCDSPLYPGYCCLDCASVAGQIHGITNSLKAKNNG